MVKTLYAIRFVFPNSSRFEKGLSVPVIRTLIENSDESEEMPIASTHIVEMSLNSKVCELSIKQG